METYSQITLEERCNIAHLQASGSSIREIATTLDRSPSTISREIKRNSDSKGRYRPLYADQQGFARRWTGSKLDRDPELREHVLNRLSSGFSPEQIAGKLALDTGRSCISYETIYRFIYAQITRTKDYRWRHLLPRAKSKRGWRGRGGGSSVSFIAHRKPLNERPKEADDRKTPGHWEADYMLFSKYGQSVLTLYERRSRILIATRQPSREAKPTAKAIKDILAPLPPAWRQTVTFDNGTEFARHYDLHGIGVKTFFCEPRKPWQKGGVENSIGRLRRHLPRKTDLDTVSKDRFENILRSYNNTPRKCLGYRTSAEIFQKEVLHFKCESTSPPARG
jgi:IS30 family transposase